jgi:hypothetical protein
MLHPVHNGATSDRDKLSADPDRLRHAVRRRIKVWLRTQPRVIRVDDEMILGEVYKCLETSDEALRAADTHLWNVERWLAAHPSEVINGCYGWRKALKWAGDAWDDAWDDADERLAGETATI